jgi:hypothetical protein
MAPQKNKSSVKNSFRLFWNISPKRMGLMIWLGACYLVLTLGHTSRPLANLWGPFWVDLGVPKWPRKKKQHRKKQFSGHFGPFLLKEWN